MDSGSKEFQNFWRKLATKGQRYYMLLCFLEDTALLRQWVQSTSAGTDTNVCCSASWKTIQNLAAMAMGFASLLRCVAILGPC